METRYARAHAVVLALLTALGGVAAGCGDDGATASASDDVTSCVDAKLDDAGKCKTPSGKTAKKSCCAAAPEKRQTLDLYACPSGADGIGVAFFDADSTLRVSKVGSVTATSATDVDVLPFAATTIAKLRKKHKLIAIVSNQGGVGKGKTKYETAEGALALTAKRLGQLGGSVDWFDFAENEDEFRKPETGMASRLDEALRVKCGVGIDMAASQMIGDSGYKKGADGPHPDGRPADDFSNADRLFAENLSIPFQEPTDAFGWKPLGVYNLLGENELIAFLDAMEAEADAVASSSASRAKTLRTEAQRIREINGL